MQVFNHNPFPITVSSITVHFSDSSNDAQFVTSIVLGASTIWTNTLNHGTPLVANALIGNLTIAPNSSPELAVTFDKPYNDDNSERIVVTFSTGGCLPLDSDVPGQQEPP
jgi:hypothetical protein